MPRRIGWGLGVWGGGSLCVLMMLRAAGVPLGESGRTVYGYSEFVLERLMLRTWPVLIAAMLVAVALRLLGARDRARRSAGVFSVAGAVAVLAVWTWWAPIAALGQHLLNLGSPGQDGAFVIESRTCPTARQYLRAFDERVGRPPEQMGSTRVISNPPGTTLLVYAINAVFAARSDPPGKTERWLMGEYGLDAAGARSLSPAVRFGIALTVAWAASAIFAFLLGRVLLSPGGAAVFALVVTFNPCTVDFTPGKDPAQLLTLNAMLWAWFAGWRSGAGPRAAVLAGVAGVSLAIGLIFGLVHAWVALIAVAATGWVELRRRRLSVMAVRQLLPMMTAAVATLVLLSITLHWNAGRSLWLVSRRFGQVQRLIYPNRSLWLAIGLPIFLPFLSPGTVVSAWLAVSRRRGQGDPVAKPLLASTLAVMGLTYVIGVSYELPRLWVAFLPTLTLGAMGALPLFHRGGASTGGAARRALPSLVAIGLVQIAFTTIHFSLMDARQSEQRVTSGRMFSAAAAAAPACGSRDIAGPIG